MKTEEVSELYYKCTEVHGNVDVDKFNEFFNSYGTLFCGSYEGFATEEEAAVNLCQISYMWFDNNESLTKWLFRNSKLLSGKKSGRYDVTGRIMKTALNQAEKLQNDISIPFNDKFENMICSLNDIEEEETEWIVSGYIPKGAITCLVGEGGAGKGRIECSLMAAWSKGDQTLFREAENPFEKPVPKKILYIMPEDDTARVIKKQLRLLEANFDYITTVSPKVDTDISLKGDFFKYIIEKHNYDIVVLDPIQAFLGENVNMAKRNDIRQNLNILNLYAQKYGITFIIVVHTNKSLNTYGRQRMADSADMWDLARSVLLVGYSEEDKLRYISQEKSNYGPLQKTVMFDIDKDGKAQFMGCSDKKDRDFVLEKSNNNSKSSNSSLNFATDFILNSIEMGITNRKDILDNAKNAGITEATFRRAQESLNDRISCITSGFGSNRKCVFSLKYGV